MKKRILQILKVIVMLLITVAFRLGYMPMKNALIERGYSQAYFCFSDLINDLSIFTIYGLILVILVLFTTLFRKKGTSKDNFILLSDVPGNRSTYIDGGPGSGYQSSLFQVNRKTWKVLHIGKRTFDNALEYETDEWKLATLADFSLLNMSVTYIDRINDGTLDAYLSPSVSFHLQKRYWVSDSNRVVVAYNLSIGAFQPLSLPDIDHSPKEKRAGIALVKREGKK